MRLVLAIIFVIAACGGNADGPAAKHLEFGDHVVASSTELAKILFDFDSIDISDPDLDAIDAGVQKLQRLTDSEMEWLDTHPPDPCYAVTHLSWSSAMTLYGQAAKLYREAIAENDPNKTMQGDAAAAQGEAAVQKATDSIPISKQACGT